MNTKSKFYIRLHKDKGEDIEVPESAFRDFMNNELPEQTMVRWRNKKGEIQGMKKSAVAGVYEQKKEIYPELPEWERDESMEARASRMVQVEEMRRKVAQKYGVH